MAIQRTQAQQSNNRSLGSQIYRTIRLLLVIAVAMGLLWGWYIAKDPDRFPIRSIKVQATYQHVDRLSLENIIMPYVNHGFFNLNTSHLQKQLLELPWLADAKIHRIWPDTIVIKLTEQQAAAKWGNISLINADGQIFTPALNTFPSGLPVLNGPDNEVEQLWQYYREMSAILAPLGLKIKELNLNARQALNLILTDDTQILLGRTHAEDRLKQFASVYKKIFTSSKVSARTVDLRYDNGLAISWRNNIQ